MNCEILIRANGRMLDVMHPVPGAFEGLSLTDFAVLLSRKHRFCGQIEWDVLRHSVLCAGLALAQGEDEQVIRDCAMHDIAEAFLGDIPSPQKQNLLWRSGLGYEAVERVMRAVICTYFGFRFCGSSYSLYDGWAYSAEVNTLWPPNLHGILDINSGNFPPQEELILSLQNTPLPKICEFFILLCTDPQKLKGYFGPLVRRSNGDLAD